MAESYAPAADLDFILARLRNASINELTDSNYIEFVLLPDLGFHLHPLDHYPLHLQRFCGTGVHSMQLPNQFAKYLAFLATKKVANYIEIGVSWGGTFIITVEFLKRFNNQVKALAVDLIDPEPNIRNYLLINTNCSYLIADSKSSRFRDALNEQQFDLALIDGDHSEEGCYQDYQLLKNYSKIIAFHDIANDITPGVKKVWSRLREEHHHSRCYEFVDQYPEVKSRQGYSFMGLGAIELNPD